MNDLYTKIVLGIIALCLVALVAQGYGLGPGRSEAARSANQERYRLVPVPMVRTLLRIDQETGETWFSPLLGHPRWRSVDEFTGEGEAEEDAAEPDQAPSGATDED